tara:strand:+ start:33 stop:797 length:765 start_codon:yes stop_codon:yes gene_type:complete
MKYGDFSALAKNYDKFRPSYSNKIPYILLKYFTKKPLYCDIASGTGIFASLCAENNLRPNFIVEPNPFMISYAKKNLKSIANIKYFQNNAESINLRNNTVNLISIASAFHWFNFNSSLNEFNRILKHKGVICLCWNTRDILKSDIQYKFEKKLINLNGGDFKRKSSGKSIDKDIFTNRLMKTNLFSSVDYFEISHTENFSKRRYIGAWESVNDIRVSLGEKKFNGFINYLEKNISSNQLIDSRYKNKIWIACKK